MRGRRSRGRGSGRWVRGRRRCRRVEVCSGEEQVDARYDTGAAVQRSATTVNVEAQRTDATALSSQLHVELQCEGGWEWVAVLSSTPAVAPLTTASYWAPFVRRWHVVNNRQHTKLTAEVEDE
jgi:hypothetical protein